MSLQDYASIGTIISAVVVAFSLVVALLTYLRQYVHQQINQLRESLFICEKDAERMYRDYDQKFLYGIVDEIVSHSWMQVYVKKLIRSKNTTDQQFAAVLDNKKQLLSHIVMSVLIANKSKPESDYEINFRVLIDRTRHKYAVLSLFLDTYLKIIHHCMIVLSTYDNYMEVIQETIKKMKSTKDLEKYTTVDDVLAFLANVLIMNVEQKIEKQRLNTLLPSMRDLGTEFFNLYRSKSDWGLWLPMRRESRKIAERILKLDSQSKRIEEMVSLKIKGLPQNRQFEITVLTGKLINILTMNIS